MQKITLTALLMICALLTRANNLKIENVNVNAGTATFTISWDNSWNASGNLDTLYPTNWDAAWIFIKVQSDTTNLWTHLNVSATGHTASAGTDGAALTIEVPDDNVGVFIRRSDPGHGPIEQATISLSLAALPQGNNFNFKVLGIEMVHIPEGAFYLNDSVTSNTTEPRFNNVNISGSTGFSGGQLYTGSPVVPAAFPLGYDAFYAMKYEVTNDQAIDFLNTLTYDQQATHIDVAPNSASGTAAYVTVSGYVVQNYIRIAESGINNTQPAVFGCDYNNDGMFNLPEDGGTVACGSLSLRSMLAYLDWCGLRTMTELEFEKICRGSRSTGNPVERVPHEYVWGTTDYVNHNHSSNITDADMPTMHTTATIVNGRSFTAGGNRPFRAGLFAEGSTGRAASGAGYYGNMNMGDNLAELTVRVHADGTGYTGTPGDGILAVDGASKQINWPEAGGYGYRSGYFNGSPATSSPGYHVRIGKLSNRYGCSTPGNITGTTYWIGFRGVR